MNRLLYVLDSLAVFIASAVDGGRYFSEFGKGGMCYGGIWWFERRTLELVMFPFMFAFSVGIRLGLLSSFL